MRRLLGGKTDSKADLLKNSFILFFIIFSSLSFSQIPINGFCSQINYPIPKSYQSIISTDLNSNGNDELIFYSPAIKSVGIFAGIPGEESELKEYQINSEISQLKRINNKSGDSNLFAAVERKQRRVLLMDIFIDSVVLVKNKIEFDSYPENIFVGDVDLDGKEEILVSGSGFDGISILSLGSEGIGERKIITEMSFSEAVFIDFNDDGYPDVIAFNILDNSLQLFTNNTKGIFRQTRSLRYSEKLNFLKTADFNKDGINDLIYSYANFIEILYGDYQAVFNEKKIIKLDDRVSGIVIGDFNGDKLLDISYSLVKGTLNLLFAKKDADFYESVTYLKGIGFFAKFKFGGKDNVVTILESGEVATITTVKEINNDLRIVPAIQVGALKKFDYGKDNISDICFVDEYDNFLKIFLTDKSGIPSLLYYFPLVETHKEIVVGDFFSQLKTFYCYTEGTPLLEVFNYNFKTNKINRKQLYAPGEILDLNLQRVDSSLVNIFLVYNKQSKLHLGKFENRDLSITFREYPFVDRNVTTAKIRIKDEPEIFYWKSESDTLYFNMADIESGPNILKTYFKIPKSDDLNINLYGANFYNGNYPSVVSFVQSDAAKYILSFSGNRFSKSLHFFSTNDDVKKQFGRGFFGETTTKGIINFTVNTSDDDYINTLIYSERGKTYLLSQTIAADNVSDYFFIKPDQKNYLIYSNTKGELSLVPIKK